MTSGKVRFSSGYELCTTLSPDLFNTPFRQRQDVRDTVILIVSDFVSEVGSKGLDGTFREITKATRTPSCVKRYMLNNFPHKIWSRIWSRQLHSGACHFPYKHRQAFQTVIASPGIFAHAEDRANWEQLSISAGESLEVVPDFCLHGDGCVSYTGPAIALL